MPIILLRPKRKRGDSDHDPEVADGGASGRIRVRVLGLYGAVRRIFCGGYGGGQGKPSLQIQAHSGVYRSQ
ncbi:hypothetical protein D3C81_1939770 [compost metagenome]